MASLTISEVAAEVGLSTDTLRYYERFGLIEPPARNPNGYRSYDPATAQRVRFIKGAQRTGLRLREIRELLDIKDRGACPCGHTRGLVERRLAEIDKEIRHLRDLHRQLRDLLVGLDRSAEQPTGVWWCEDEFTKKGGDQR